MQDILPLFELCPSSRRNPPPQGRRRWVGKLVQLSATSPEGVVLVTDDADGVMMTTTTSTLPVTFPWRQRVPHLDRVVAALDGPFSVAVECDEHCVVVRATLHLDERALCRCLEQGTHAFDGELALVHLLASSWRELAVVGAVQGDESDTATVPEDDPLLLPHQRASLAWMAHLEESQAPLRYEGHLRMGSRTGWYLDTETESFTRDPSWREAEAPRGGVLADAAGSGKTATMLRHCVTRCRRPSASSVVDDHYMARGTLIIVPLNLPAQWLAEAARWYASTDGVVVRRMIRGSDARGLTMRDLLEADVVITTFHFLRGSRTYQDLVDTAVQSEAGLVERTDGRAPAALAAWRRAPGRTTPILEAVHWHRIAVDELHECLADARNVRLLRQLRATHVWGITATPDLTSEAAQHLYWLLRREKAHHPNLLARLVQRCVRAAGAPLASDHLLQHDHHAVPRHSNNHLLLVDVSADERRAIDALPLMEGVKRCTYVDGLSDGGGADACTVRELESCYAAAFAREDGERHVECTVLRRAVDEALGAPDASQLEAAWQRAHAARRPIDERMAFVAERIATLAGEEERCSVCLDAPCGVITSCGHLFCRGCAKRLPTCPTCRAPIDQLRAVVHDETGASWRKLDAMAALVHALHEPVIVFAQWKAMLKTMRACLRGKHLRVLSLEGNASQRARTLDEFASGGGTTTVLLLCLEESFAGLHLPMARHIFFSHALVATDRAAVRALEYQAVARCLRRGQQHEVVVHSFVIADCAEETAWRWAHPAEEEEEEEPMLLS